MTERQDDNVVLQFSTASCGNLWKGFREIERSRILEAERQTRRAPVMRACTHTTRTSWPARQRSPEYHNVRHKILIATAARNEWCRTRAGAEDCRLSGNGKRRPTKRPPAPLAVREYLTLWYIENHAIPSALSSAMRWGAIGDGVKSRAKSAMRSPASSMPTESRTRSGGESRSAPTSGENPECDMHAGGLMAELMLPKRTQMLNIRAASAKRSEASAAPVVRLITTPAPRACLRCKRQSVEVVSRGSLTPVA